MAASATIRNKIAEHLVSEIISTLDGVSSPVNIYENCEKGLKFWDEVEDAIFVFVSPGRESREYQPSNFVWGYLNLTIYVYVECEEDTQAALDPVLHELEKVITINYRSRLTSLPSLRYSRRPY